MLEVRLIKNYGEHGESDESQPDVRVEIPSRRHLGNSGLGFKIGYFFSPSNPTGFNRVLRKIVGEDLYSILNFNLSSPSPFKPDWKSVKDKVTSIRTKLHALREDCGGFHNVHAVRRRDDGHPKNEQEALEIFRSIKKEAKVSGFSNFSSEQGEFLLLNPWNVTAVIPADNVNGVSGVCCYVIVEEDLTCYIEALDIVEETVDFVLSQSDREVFYLFWSV